MLTVEGLTVKYSGQRLPALHDVTFDVKKGEWVTLVGISGAGKSSILMSIIRQLPINAGVNGEIRFDNKLIDNLTFDELKQNIGIVLQNPQTQLLSMSVRDELLLSQRCNTIPVKQNKAKLDFVIDLLKLESLYYKNIYELSSGEKQKIAIAQALVKDIKLLLLDEPTSYLDDASTNDFILLLKKIKNNTDVSILMIEHKINALRVSDRLVILKDGKLIRTDKPCNIIDDKEICYANGIAPNTDVMLNLKPPESNTLIVDGKNISFSYNKRDYVLKEVCFDLFKQSFTSVHGKNGSGKTTLAKIVAGFLKPGRGKLTYYANKMKRKPRKSQVFLTLSNPKYQFLCDTVAEEFELVNRNLRLSKKYNNYNAVLEEVVGTFDLSNFMDRKNTELSFGQQQRLTLAVAALTKPDILILDEPTLSQDWVHITGFFNYLQKLNNDGITIIFTTHNKELIEFYSNRRILL